MNTRSLYRMLMQCSVCTAMICCGIMLCSIKHIYGQGHRNSTSPQVLQRDLTQCKVWLADGAHERVLKWMDSVAAENRSNVMMYGDAVYVYGVALQARDMYDKAISLYWERLRYDSTDTDCAQSLGACLNVVGRYKEAVSILEKARVQDEQNISIIRTLAQVLFNDNQFDRARSYYALLIDKGMRNVFYYAQIARCYAKSDNETLQKNATSYYTLIGYELAPTNRSLILESTEFLRIIKAPHHALTVLNRAVQTFPDDATLHAERGKNLLLQNKYHEAQQAFSKALVLGDSSRTVLRELGISYYLNRSFDTARFYLEAALRTNIASPDARTLAFLGVVYREGRQFHKAQVMFSNALKIQKTNEIADMIVQQGLTYKYAGQTDSAFAKYVMAQQLDPDDADVFYEMGTLLEGNPANRSSARQCFVAYLERTSAQSSKAAQYARKRLQEWGYDLRLLRQNVETTATLTDIASVLSGGSSGTSSATIDGTINNISKTGDVTTAPPLATTATQRLVPKDLHSTTTHTTIPKNK